jgi:hypothetical protein
MGRHMNVQYVKRPKRSGQTSLGDHSQLAIGNWLSLASGPLTPGPWPLAPQYPSSVFTTFSSGSPAR